ncbi:hypothetical protein [Streptomyces abikoensis]|uniref:Guanylate cyclase domain-containing protein n=1 Tax=Streptomyces abikoensis TaxID=97398 RepID=A0ABW7TDG6_9ACTN
MGRPGEFKRPVLSKGPLKDLNEALHELHLRAGLPTLSVMSKEVGHRVSRSSLHEAFTGTARPPWDTVDALVEILATRARQTSPEREIDRFQQLWVDAARSVLASPPALVGQTTGPSGFFAPHWIMFLDVAGFSRRSDPAQMRTRHRLHTLLNEALEFAGAAPVAHRIDRGDGVLVVASTDSTGLGAVLGFLLHLQRLLRRQAADDAEVRIRLSLIQGLISLDDNGWVGAPLNLSLRLVDAHVLRELLASTPAAHLAVIVSHEVHSTIRERSYLGFTPAFTELSVETKEGTYPTWAYLADHATS